MLKSSFTMDFFPKCFTEFSEFSETPNDICHYSKRAPTCHTAASWDTRMLPQRHVEAASLNWVKFMLQWFSNSLNSVKVLLYFGKIPMSTCRQQSVYFTSFYSLCAGPSACRVVDLCKGSFIIEQKRKQCRFQPVALFPICVFILQRQRSKEIFAFALI